MIYVVRLPPNFLPKHARVAIIHVCTRARHPPPAHENLLASDRASTRTSARSASTTQLPITRWLLPLTTNIMNSHSFSRTADAYRTTQLVSEELHNFLNFVSNINRPKTHWTFSSYGLSLYFLVPIVIRLPLVSSHLNRPPWDNGHRQNAPRNSWEWYRIEVHDVDTYGRNRNVHTQSVDRRQSSSHPPDLHNSTAISACRHTIAVDNLGSNFHNFHRPHKCHPHNRAT